MGKIYERLVGTVCVELCGALPESFLNSCALRGLELWSLNCIDQYTLTMTAYESDFEELKIIAEKCMCSLELVKTTGGSENRRFLRRRFWLLTLLFAASSMIMLSSLFVWDIEIHGNEKVSSVRILRELSQCGVGEGSFWPGISPELVRSKMMTKIPELAWMTVNISGSRAIVLINERQEKPEIYKESEPADITAKQTGIIRKVSVMNGRSLVSPNQTVVKDQLLVSAAMESLDGDVRFVCSRASIMADTCHEIRMVYPSICEEKTGPKKTKKRFALKIGKKRINFYLKGRNNIDECDKIISKAKLGIGGLFALPLELVKEQLVFYEKAENNTDLSDLLCEQQLEKLKDRISGEVKHSSFYTYEKQGLSYVNLYVQCYEDIAQSLIISP